MNKVQGKGPEEEWAGRGGVKGGTREQTGGNGRDLCLLVLMATLR